MWPTHPRPRTPPMCRSAAGRARCRRHAGRPSMPRRRPTHQVRRTHPTWQMFPTRADVSGTHADAPDTPDLADTPDAPDVDCTRQTPQTRPTAPRSLDTSDADVVAASAAAAGLARLTSDPTTDVSPDGLVRTSALVPLQPLRVRQRQRRRDSVGARRDQRVGERPHARRRRGPGAGRGRRRRRGGGPRRPHRRPPLRQRPGRDQHVPAGGPVQPQRLQDVGERAAGVGANGFSVEVDFDLYIPPGTAAPGLVDGRLRRHQPADRRDRLLACGRVPEPGGPDLQPCGDPADPRPARGHPRTARPARRSTCPTTAS